MNALPYLVLALFLLPGLVASGGMFFDGVTYSAIARNLAEGVGTFWAPHYTQTTYPQFYEHPPLGFFWQSLIYRLLGDAFWVDALWGILMGTLTLSAISLHWTRREETQTRWWPLLLWLCFPITGWAFKNNLLETMVAPCLLFSALFADEALFHKHFVKRILFAALAGTLMTLAFLIKGPVAGFVLAVAPLRWLTSHKISKQSAITVTLVMGLGAITSLGIIVLPERTEGILALTTYLNQQVARSLVGMRELAPSRFYLLKRLILEILCPLALGYFAMRWTKEKPQGKNENAKYYTLLGFCGSLPLLSSPKQMGWYLIPSLPFFALGIASYFKHTAPILDSKLKRPIRWGIFTTLCVATITLTFLNRGAIFRDAPTYRDLVLQKISLPPRTNLSVCPKGMMEHRSLIAIVQRFQRASLTTEPSSYWLRNLSSDCPVPPKCVLAQPKAAEAYELFYCANGVATHSSPPSPNLPLKK